MREGAGADGNRDRAHRSPAANPEILATMPNRYIREDAIESEALNAVSWQAEVFYRRLLNRVDDFGRFTANHALLRASIFPLQLEKVRDSDMPRLLAECEKAGLLFVYSADSKPWLVINKWEKGRASSSKIPSPPADICEQMRTFVYSRKHLRTSANICKHLHTDAPDSAPDSDADSDTDADPSATPSGATGERVPAAAKEPPATKSKPRERNALLDALATVGGGDPTQVPAGRWSAVQRCLRDIKSVCPEVTVEEIARRCQNYRKHYSDAKITPEALAKHWALCDSLPLDFAGTPREYPGMSPDDPIMQRRNAF